MSNFEGKPPFSQNISLVYPVFINTHECVIKIICILDHLVVLCLSTNLNPSLLL